MQVIEYLIKAINAIFNEMNDADKASCQSLAYTIVKKRNGKSWVNASEEKVIGIPDLNAIMDLINNLPSDTYQIVWYAFGGKTQSVKGPIKRVEYVHSKPTSFHDGVADGDTPYDEPEITVDTTGRQMMITREGQPTLGDRTNAIALQQIERNSGVQVQFMESTLASLLEGFKQVLSTQMEMSNSTYRGIRKRERRLEKEAREDRRKTIEVVDKFSAKVFEQAELIMTHADHKMRVANELEQNALLRNRSAQQLAAKAASDKQRYNEALENLEKEIEEGKTDGFFGFLERIIGKSEAGLPAMIAFADKIFGLLEKAVTGKGAKDRLEKMGGVDTVGNLLQLSADQKKKLKDLMGE